ncbi:MAG: DUF547 domain-containing protein [Chlamydiota bacterium]|nr:DUF547 domain-containing protein [Chlamydiota bacterium]
MFRCSAFFIFFLLSSHILYSNDFDHHHTLLTQLLKQYVDGGLVDYRSLKQHPEQLNQYLAMLSEIDQKDFQNWSKHEQLAFLINLYNAQTLALIIEHYPVKGIKDIKKWFKGPWDIIYIKLFDQEVSLNEIEHKLIRAKFKDPRIHFALVCGAKGCPPLRSEAYTAFKLKDQLDDQGRIFLNDTTKNYVNDHENTIYLSPIFNWFKEDFLTISSSIIDFVKPFLFDLHSKENKDYNIFSIEYTDYDWSLNIKDD